MRLRCGCQRVGPRNVFWFSCYAPLGNSAVVRTQDCISAHLFVWIHPCWNPVEFVWIHPGGWQSLRVVWPFLKVANHHDINPSSSPFHHYQHHHRRRHPHRHHHHHRHRHRHCHHHCHCHHHHHHPHHCHYHRHYHLIVIITITIIISIIITIIIITITIIIIIIMNNLSYFKVGGLWLPSWSNTSRQIEEFGYVAVRVEALLSGVSAIADFAGIACHWYYAREKRYCHSSELVKLPSVPPTDLRVKELFVWFFVGLLFCLWRMVRMLYYGWAPSMVQSFSPPLKILAITASTIFTLTIVLIPAALPQLATILYLQRDLEHLAAELMRAVDVGAAQEFKQLLGKVSSTKRRWEGFLFWHFLLNGTGTIMYALEEVFAFNHATVVMNAPMNWAGPLVAVFLLWQVTCVARFNGQICLCLETTDNDTLHRLLCQHKNKLEFSVLGLSITFTKIKAVMTSVIFSVISKAVIALVSLKVWCLQRMEYLFGKFRKVRKVSPSPILHPALSCSARACGKTSAYDMEWQYAQKYLAKYASLTHWSTLEPIFHMPELMMTHAFTRLDIRTRAASVWC